MPTIKNIKMTLSSVAEYSERNFDIIFQDATHEQSVRKLDNLNKNQFGSYVERVLARCEELGHFVLLLPSEKMRLVCRKRFAHRYFVESQFGNSIFIFSFAPRYDLFIKVKFRLMTPQANKSELFKSVLSSYSYCKKILDIEPSGKHFASELYGRSYYDYHMITSDRKLFSQPLKIKSNV